MLFAFGNVNDRVKIHHPSFEPFRGQDNAVGSRRAGIDLAAQERRIKLGAAIADHEFWIFEAENVAKQTALNVGRESHRLPSDPDSRGGSQFCEAVQAGLLSAEKDRMIDAIRRPQVEELVDIVHDSRLAE